MVFEGLTSYSTPISCLSGVFPFDWLAGGWLAAGWVAGWPAGWLAGGLAGWLAGWLAGLGWLAGIYYMDGWYLMSDVGSRFDGHESDLVLDLVLDLVQSAFVC